MGKEKQLALVIGLVVVGFIAVYFLTKKKPADAEGDTQCIDSDLYIFRNGQWELEEANSPACQLPEPIEPPWPDENPPLFEIDKVLVSPVVAILGNPVEIKVYWFCPNPLLITRSFGITCMVDGKILQKAWETRSGNGSVKIAYTPEALGSYTAIVLDKSCTFEVREEVIGAYYCPFGGVTIYASIDALATHIGPSHRESKPALGQGKYYEYIPCPYCGKEFRICTRSAGLSCASGQRIGAAYALLDHIQVSHSNRPLTRSRTLIVVDVPVPGDVELLASGFSKYIGVPWYAAIIDGKWRYIGWKVYPTLDAKLNEYQRTTAFVAPPGTYHVIIKGPSASSRYSPTKSLFSSAPTVFDEDITLVNLGDKAVFDIETGMVEVVEWRW